MFVGRVVGWYFGFSIAGLLSCFFALNARSQQVISVPGQAATVQSAIGMAADGDTVRIAPGTYREKIDFQGKNITVEGSAPGVILAGIQSGPIVTFDSGESRSAVLQNVTITSGPAGTAPGASGIFINGASPTIQNSTITANQWCGIEVLNGAPAIMNNEISGNLLPQYSSGCVSFGGDPLGGGIVLSGAPPNGTQALIVGNTIENNQVIYGAAGINVLSAGIPLIKNNVIRNNTSEDKSGGIYVADDTAPLIVQNLIYGNTIDPVLIHPAVSDTGAGINVAVTTGAYASDPVLIVNNTIANNILMIVPGAATEGSQFFASQHMERVYLTNNLIIGSTSQAAVNCFVPLNVAVSSPTFDHNDVFASGLTAGQSAYSGNCSDQTGSSGNISADPLFASDASSNQPFQLRLPSPAIDAGDNQVQALPSMDILGQPRVQNAKGLTNAIVDMGVYEYAGVPTTLPPAGFQLNLSSSSLKIQQGNTGVVSATVTPAGNNLGTVILGCTGLPSNYSCSFSPATLNFTSTASQSSTLTITPAQTAQTSAVPNQLRNRRVVSLSCMLAAFVFLRKRRKHSYRNVAVMLLFGCTAFLLSGCGPTQYVAITQPTTVQISVQATSVDSGAIEHQALTLVIS